MIEEVSIHCIKGLLTHEWEEDKKFHLTKGWI